MKKFSRIFLILSGIVVIVGIAMVITGVAMGAPEKVADDLLNNRFVANISSSFVEDEEELKNMHVLDEKGYAVSQNEVEDISLDGKIGQFRVEAWDNDYYFITAKKDSKYVRYSIDNGQLRVTVSGKEMLNNSILFWNDGLEVIIYVPKTATIDNANFEVGAGTLECSGISASTLVVDIGAGEGDFTNVVTEAATFNVGAGECNIDDSTAGTCHFEVGIGDLNFEGNIAGDTVIKCGMGNVEMELLNSYTDFNYSLQVGLGNVDIGNDSYSGLSHKKDVNNNALNKIDIDCGMGNVSVEFNEY